MKDEKCGTKPSGCGTKEDKKMGEKSHDSKSHDSKHDDKCGCGCGTKK